MCCWVASAPANKQLQLSARRHTLDDDILCGTGIDVACEGARIRRHGHARAVSASHAEKTSVTCHVDNRQQPHVDETGVVQSTTVYRGEKRPDSVPI